MGKPVRVLMIASEVGSFARTGGLGDMVEGLARGLAAAAVEVVVVTPLYGFGVTSVPPDTKRWPFPLRIDRAPKCQLEVVETGVAAGSGSVRVMLLDIPHLYDRKGIYGDEHGLFGDNQIRFAALCRGALAIGDHLWSESDGARTIVHAHDWHSALAPLYARSRPSGAMRASKQLFSIHNLAYQGRFDLHDAAALGLSAEVASGQVVHDGRINFMKSAIVAADRVSTVSATYAREILETANGCGLEHAIASRGDSVAGIENGIDLDLYDPSHDSALAVNYNASNALPQRALCKRALAAEVGLDTQDDGPLFATVSRLTWQKGIDSVIDIAPQIVATGGRILFVGGGDASLSEAILRLVEQYPGRVVGSTEFDDALARRAYAGADFVLMPSRYEPCGLTQQYAMRYGAVPIVTPVGGLLDTVMPYDPGSASGTGIVAASHAPHHLIDACRIAFDLYRDRTAMAGIIARAMARDNSWARSTQEYLALYEQMLSA